MKHITPISDKATRDQAGFFVPLLLFQAIILVLETVVKDA